MARARQIARTLLPRRVRRSLRRPLDAVNEIRTMPERLERLETLMLESYDAHQERSQRRWSNAAPDALLTWGQPLTGDAFVSKVGEHGAFGPERVVVEIGPGYGRLLDAALRVGVPFARWTGIDLSPRNVDHLSERFAGDERVSFVNGDAQTVRLGEPADSVVSSLTWKHMYPSFEASLANLAPQVREGGMFFVDLIEGERRYFQKDGTTYIRWYTRAEVSEIFGRCGCEVEAFDYVDHDAEHRRLLVVARRR